jgi:hypothetical protein
VAAAASADLPYAVAGVLVVAGPAGMTCVWRMNATRPGGGAAGGGLARSPAEVTHLLSAEYPG